MTRLSGTSWQEMVRALELAGFHLERQKGSHMVFVSAAGNRTVVVPRHSALKPGTVSAILRAAGLSREDLLR